MSKGIGVALAETAKDMSYAKSSEYVSGKKVSRQTAMNLIRRSEAVEQEVTEIKEIPELHIDTDEAHLTIRQGKKSEVPLISVYEGIVNEGKRLRCANIFHISEYGKKRMIYGSKY